MKSKKFIDISKKCLIGNYAPAPVVIESGAGAEVVDVDGCGYLDFVSGLAVSNLGHCHPKVVGAIQQQAARLLHVSNLYHNIPQIELAELLIRHSFADRAFFCNSGAEANEAAIKLVRRFSFDRYGAGRFGILTAVKSFHGRTMATLTATGQEKVHKGFEPLLPGFDYVPYSNLDAVRAAINPGTAAIMVEPVQGESGVIVPSAGYLAGLRQIADEHSLLLVFDEIQTGMGRTGTLFAYEQSGVEPDIITLAKGLGGGMPIGAMLAREEVAASFVPGTHGSTFGGNPVAAAAAKAVLELLIDDGSVLANVEKISSYLLAALKPFEDKFSFVTELRGVGMMFALELAVAGAGIVEHCRKNGLLVNCTAGNVIRLLPPLNITAKEVDRAVAILDGAFRVCE